MEFVMIAFAIAGIIVWIYANFAHEGKRSVAGPDVHRWSSALPMSRRDSPCVDQATREPVRRMGGEEARRPCRRST